MLRMRRMIYNKATVKILRFYIVKEFFPLFLLSFVVFTSILLLGNMLQLLEMVGKGGTAAWKLVAYIPVFSLSYSMPMATLAATMMSFGRLAQDNEITAVKAGGIKVFSLFIPIFLIGLLLSLLSLHLNNSFVPRAKYRFEVLSQELGMKKPALLLRERVFIKEFSGYRLFLEKVKGNSLYGVHIWRLREAGAPLTIFARRGEVTSNSKKRMITIKLMNGTREEVDPGTPGEYSRSKFSVYYFNLLLPEERERTDKRPKEMTIRELREGAREIKGKGAYPLLVEIHRKISLSFACLTFVLIGAPLGVMVRKGGKSIGFGLSFLLILLYYMITMLGESLGERGIFPPVLTMWTSTVLLAGIGFFLILRRIER